MKTGAKIIVPVDNGFAVAPFDLDIAYPIKKMKTDVRVANSVAELQAVIGELFSEDVNQCPASDTYEIPDELKGDWPVSKETVDHMNDIAKQQQANRCPRSDSTE